MVNSGRKRVIELMSLEFWFRRLVSYFAGSPDAIKCNLCKTVVPASHIKKGFAVMIAQRTYCRGCVSEITERKSGAWPLAGADAGSSSTIHLP
jgi:LSD1 subclass zinc finger protein